MDDDAVYAGFLGRWILIPESCDYEQGEAPRDGAYRIEAREGRLWFTMEWTEADGTTRRAAFDGVPDGVPVPFAGGEAADALSVHAVSRRELRSSAYWQGEELMVAQRQLDESGTAMRVTQIVRFRDGTRLANVAVYRKYLPS